MRAVLLNSDVLLAFVVVVLAAGDSPARLRAAGQVNSARSAPTPRSKPVEPAEQPLAPEADPKSKSQPADEADVDASPTAEEEEAIRQSGMTFAAAYNEGDAAAVAAHFTLGAEYVDQKGDLFQGRLAIEEALGVYFAEHPGSRLEVTIDSIRFVSAGVAIEDGSTNVIHPEGGDSDGSLYTAVHVKVDDQWLTASSREHAPKSGRQHSAQLEQLAWLQGEWVDEDDDSIVEFSCHSVDNGNFLLRNFVVKIAGEEAQSGTQRIGWDPVTGKLRTWIFDSDGGYGEGTWRRDGECWILKTTGVTADGQTASGTSIYTLMSDHIITWQGIDHEIDGEPCEDSEVITVVRKPPAPVLADDPLAND